MLKQALIGLVILVLTLTDTAVAQTLSDSWRQCTGAGSDARIRGCTAIIESGKESDARLAYAFYYRGAAYYVSNQDDDSAIRDFDEAIRRNPKFADAFNSRGAAFMRKQDYDRAIQDYDQAIGLNSKFGPAYSNRGIAYRNKGDFEHAIRDYDQAIRL